MNSPENTSEDGSEEAADSIEDRILKGSSQADLDPSDSAQAAPSKHEIDADEDAANDPRREKRRRTRMFERLSKAFGIDDRDVVKTMLLLDELQPDPGRMSTSEKVAERLKHASEEADRKWPKLLFRRSTRTPIDITKADNTFHNNADLEGLLDNEETLLRALLVNDRMASGYRRFADEHEEMRALLLQEYVRRSALVEQWRYTLPKFMLPIFSMLFAAGARRPELREHAALFNRIRDTIHEWSAGRVTKKELMAAARITEQEFIDKWGETNGDGEPLEPDGSRKSGSAIEAGDGMAQCRRRLQTELESAREDARNSARVMQLESAKRLGGGIDSRGRLVLPSIEDLATLALTTATQSHFEEADRCQGSSVEDSQISSVIERQLAAEDALPAPRGNLVFNPADVKPWPKDNMQLAPLIPKLPRSTGLSRSLSDEPFKPWRADSQSRPPRCYMGLRLQPDLSAREGLEGPIEPVDLARLELGSGLTRARFDMGVSPILGQAHPLMLPPHSSLGWYGRTLGWSDEDIEALDAFGSPARPETVRPEGDKRNLLNAFRKVAAARLITLAREQPEHFLGEPKLGAERRIEAAEDLARYWLFVLLARHDEAGFDALYPHDFFHGVHGPDFVVDEKGAADFGKGDEGSYIRLWSVELMDRQLSQPLERDTKFIPAREQPFEGARRSLI